MIQGFIHPHPYVATSTDDTDSDTPIPSISLSSLTLSVREVAHAFHLPLTALHTASRLHEYMFRGSTPYYAIDVSDIITAHEEGSVVSSDGPVAWASDPAQRDEIGGGKEGRLEVWGLTGWYVNVLMRALKLYD